MSANQDSQILSQIRVWFRENMGLAFLLTLSALLRFLFLEMKASHFDEGVYGFFVQEIWRKGFFPYDPSNFHGPIYYYALQISEQIFGRGLFAFRFMSGVFSILTVYHTWRLNKFFGEVAVWAAIAVAFSPSAVFYSRYAMHESLFILLQVLFIHQIYELKSELKLSTACKLGLYAGLCFATKETTIIFLFCILFSIFLAELIPWPKTFKLRPRIGLISVVSFLSLSATIVFVFSCFGAEPNRIADFFKAYSFWTKTGVEHLSGHEKPFGYWYDLLVRYEWPALIGLLVSPFLLLFGSKNSRLFSFFALGTLLAYSIIPYKTPWCILGIVWPFCLLFGFALTELRSYAFFKNIAIRATALTKLQHARSNAISSFLAIVVCLISLGFAIQLNFFRFHAVKEPYVYVQSSADINIVSNLIKQRVQLFPEDLNMNILIALKASWPFPWLLADFTHVEYRELFMASASEPESQTVTDQKRVVAAADVIIVDQIDEKKIEQQISKPYLKSEFRLRDSYNTCVVFFNAQKFKFNQQSLEAEIANHVNLGGDSFDMKFVQVEPIGTHE